jgi:hypothetical protein
MPPIVIVLVPAESLPTVAKMLATLSARLATMNTDGADVELVSWSIELWQ